MSAAPETVMDVAELCRARDLLDYSDEVLAADPLVLAGLALSISIGAVVGLLYGGGKHLWAQLRARRVA